MIPVCEVDDVSKNYGNRAVVKRASFRVHRHEVVALMGASGSGKSTMLNMIGGLERADSGKILICGKHVSKPASRKTRQLLRSDIGYLFQNFALIDNETVESNLMVAQRYSDQKGFENRFRALRAVGMEGSEDRKVFELSGGEQQRVSLARLFLKPCSLILADEPTGSLDRKNRDEVMSHLRNLADNGKGVLVVTHDTDVARMCDRIIKLP